MRNSAIFHLFYITLTFLPQLPLILQSDWLICRCRALKNKQFSLLVDVAVKKQIECGLALSVLLPTMTMTMIPTMNLLWTHSAAPREATIF